MPTPSKLPPGIQRTATGYRAWVRLHHGAGGLKSKTFSAGAGLLTMRRWRESQRLAPPPGSSAPSSTGTLRADVRSYLQQVQTMPTLRHRRDDLALWLRAFGPERDRTTITAGEIRAQLEDWRAAGYAANTCNHRRTALMHLYTVLDGKSARNIVRDVPRYRDESLDAPPRALSPIACALLLDAMPASLTRCRLALMAWTGWPPAQIGKLEPADVRWNDAVFVRPRRKGKGAAGVWLPLLPQAWAALEAFKKAGAWGTYSTSSARTSLRLAARKIRETIMLPLPLWTELEDTTPYQFRHAFLSLVAGISKDDRAVQTLGQHADLRTSHRYTSGTADPRAAAALGLVTLRLHSEAGSPQATDPKGP